MELTTEIQKIIEKNLPSATAQTLNYYLLEADSNKKKIENLLKEIEEYRKKNDKYTELIEREKILVTKEQALTIREKENEKKDIYFELALVRKENELLKTHKQDIYNLVYAAFRNKSLLFSETENKQIALPSGGHSAGVTNCKTTSVQEE